MRRLAWLGAVLAVSACASAPRPGPTLEGVAVTVPAAAKITARREAIESLLPLFVTPAARRAKSAEIDKAAFAGKMKPFVGYEKISKKGTSLVEIKLDPLSAELQRVGVVRPPGYSSGIETVLIAFGDRSVGPSPTERVAVDAFETALFGRGIQAQDADDQLVILDHKITAKTDKDTLAQARAFGWSWLALGGVAGVAHKEPQSKAYRSRARYTIDLYDVYASSDPTRFEADGEALDVSSAAAVTEAMEQAAQEAAVRVESAMSKRHVGRSTIAVMASGWKDPVFLKHLIEELRGLGGVEGAALMSWHGLDEMALIHVYAGTLTADKLAAELINFDPEMRVTAVENEDKRLTIAGPQIPASEDVGQDQ